MKSRTYQFVLLGQICLFLFIFICFLLNPHFLLKSNEGGASNYGLYAKTVVPYSLSLGLCGLFTLLAARSVHAVADTTKFMKWTLSLLGVLYLLELISTYPYKINHTLNEIHVDVGLILVLAATIIGGWFGLFLARNKTSILILAAQVLGLVLVALTFFGFLHILFIAELLTSLSFGVLLVRTVSAGVASWNS